MLDEQLILVSRAGDRVLVEVEVVSQRPHGWRTADGKWMMEVKYGEGENSVLIGDTEAVEFKMWR